MKKFLKDMVLNPDGLTYSSKRVGGWISLVSFIAFGFMNKPEYIMYATLGLVISFFGLASFDYKQFLQAKPSAVDDSTGNAPANP